MKRLLLVRHAKSSWNHPGLSDFDRPLNAWGERDAPMMAGRLLQRGMRPERVVASPAKRAKQTAQLLSEGVGVPGECILDDERIYEASPATLLQVIGGFDDAWDFVMLVGHNPAMTSLANALANGVTDNLPTCGMVDISLNLEHWHDIASGCGTCRLYDYPKKAQ